MIKPTTALRLSSLCFVAMWALMVSASGAATSPSPTVISTNTLFPPVIARQIDDAIVRAMHDRNLPSVAVGAWLPGKGRYLYVSGSSNLATQTARRFDQPFRIASLTKTFVATAVLELVDRGKLKVSDRMSTWFPRFPNAKTITVDDLLRMRSGIAAPSDEELIDGLYDTPLMKAPTPAEQIAESVRLVGKFTPPDTHGVYTNLNYVILGEIVRKITGRDVAFYIADHILTPLHLSKTTYPLTDPRLPGGLHGYGWNAKVKRFDDKTLFNPALAGPAGAMISSMDDLRTYVRALCTGTLLKPATQRTRMRGQALVGTKAAYGEGVITGEFCGHSGTIPGFTTDMYYMQKPGAELIVSVNRLDRDDKPQTTPILTAVAKALLKLPQS